MNQKFRLTRSNDFKWVKASGSVIQHPLMILVYARNKESYSRVAVVASKSIGNAVIRNKAKRRIRAGLVTIWHEILPSWDLIFYSRFKITEANFEEINKAIRHLLLRAGVLGEEE